MNINRKKTLVNLNGKKRELILDFESAIYFQEGTGESIFKGITKISSDMDMIALAYLVAATLRDEDGELVGIEEVKKMDLISNMEPLMGAMTELMDNSIEKEEHKKAVKKK